MDSIYRYYEIADKREDYLEKHEKRKTRKNFRELINEEEGFSMLEKQQKEKLVSLLDELYSKSKKKTTSASRLSNKSVKSIQLNPVINNRKH